MREKTKIEWCDHTFNPWRGCARVSAAAFTMFLHNYTEEICCCNLRITEYLQRKKQEKKAMSRTMEETAKRLAASIRTAQRLLDAGDPPLTRIRSRRMVPTKKYSHGLRQVKRV